MIHFVVLEADYEGHGIWSDTILKIILIGHSYQVSLYMRSGAYMDKLAYLNRLGTALISDISKECF